MIKDDDFDLLEEQNNIDSITDELLDSYESENGYTYVKTPQGWKLKHRYLMEMHLDRPLKPNERVHFKDGNRHNIDIGNLEVREVKNVTLNKKLAQVKRMRQKLDTIESELERLIDENP
jgi:hypothetical protein